MKFEFVESQDPSIEDDIHVAIGTDFYIQCYNRKFYVNSEHNADDLDKYYIQDHGIFNTLDKAKAFIERRP